MSFGWDLVIRKANPRTNVKRFIERMAERHPELRSRVAHPGFLAMAARDGIHVRLATLPDRQRARTYAIGDERFIRLNRTLAIDEQTTHGMHELCHVWRDRPADGVYYSDELTGGERCEFADFFAWWVTSPARVFFDPESAQ